MLSDRYKSSEADSGILLQVPSETYRPRGRDGIGQSKAYKHERIIS